MKQSRLLVGFILPALIASGCSSMSNTEKGVGAGGLIGAGTGALIGHATGHTGAGALIGAGVGAVSGGLIGNAVDKSEEKTAAAIAAANSGPHGPLGITDIAQMAQARVADDVIISQIRTSGSVFRLSSNDIIWLKQSSVSDSVIQEMQATATRYPRRVYTAAPVYAEPVYVVEPPPPPVGIGIGFGYRGRW
jgi:hypothetical protein